MSNWLLNWSRAIAARPIHKFQDGISLGCRSSDHEDEPLYQYCFENRTVIERYPGRLRSVLSVNDRLLRVRTPNLVFLTNYSEVILEAYREGGGAFFSLFDMYTQVYVFVEDQDRLYYLGAPHVSMDGRICIDDNLKTILLNRLLNGQPPKLAELFWCSGFYSEFDADDLAMVFPDNRTATWDKRSQSPLTRLTQYVGRIT